MNTNTIEAVAERLIESGVALKKRLRGCTTAQIKEIETSFGHPLPEVYKRFLAVMGRGAGQFLVGTDLFYPRILTLRESARELLARCGAQYSLAPEDFVFLDHQGYQFMFFKVGESDPAVFRYLEGEPKPAKVFRCFSEWVAQAAEDEIEQFQRVKNFLWDG